MRANHWRARAGSRPLALGEPWLATRRGLVLYHWQQRRLRARAYYRGIWAWYATSGARCIHLHEGGFAENSGNGYTGGFQYLDSTWLAAGGGRWAPQAYLATPTVQTRVTRSVVQRDGGWHEWGTAGICGL